MNASTDARSVADAVLYEGYLLYPYRASALKNQMRWQFGVVVPQACRDAGSTENAHQHTEILIDGQHDAASVNVVVRFLHVQRRGVEVWRDGGYASVAALECGGSRYVSFDETCEREFTCTLRLGAGERAVVPIAAEPWYETTPLSDTADGDRVCGRIVRERWALHGTLSVCAQRLGPFYKVQVRTENHSEIVAAPERAALLRTAFVSAHTLLTVDGGSILSLLEPPPHAVEAAASCRNEHTWPVLTGTGNAERSASESALSSPIILYDFPQIAQSSPGHTYDATEIDELLNLTVSSLSDAEKAEARATDDRASAIVDRAEAISPQTMSQLHGSMKAIAAQDDAPGGGHVVVAGVRIARGSAVRLHPRARADVWDMFLAGKLATVAGVHTDFDERTYVAVTIDDDPATEYHQWYGRSLFFSPDEVEPVMSQ